jgi:hypothetical protein
MNRTFFAISILAVLANAGCSGVKTYQDYPWGDYSWESDHTHQVSPVQAWDAYRQTFGPDQPRPPGG